MWAKLRYKFQRFMIGRYGVDKLGVHLMWLCLALNFLCLFMGNKGWYIALLNDVLVFYEIYRILSKNYVRRSIENTRYLDFLTRMKRSWKVLKNNLTDKQYHYYLCPDCAQMVRVPRGRGKIEIHCPNCGRTFEKRS